jgi:hypothetical protein
MPVRAIPMASPVSREISAIRSADMGIRPFTVASTDWLLRKLVTRTLVLKDRLGWDIKNPAFDELYEALPVWDWAKQKTGKNKPKTKITQNRFIRTPCSFGLFQNPRFGRTVISIEKSQIKPY